MQTWLITLALTLGCEAAVVALLARRDERGRLLLLCLLLNLFTQPLATLSLNSGIASFTAIEVVVFLAETVGYCLCQPMSWRRGAVFALAANVVTTLIAVVWAIV